MSESLGTSTSDRLRTSPGPLVVACAGARCAGLRKLAGNRDGLADLRGAVGRTGGGVLVMSGCLGPCTHGAVVAVGPRQADEPRETPAPADRPGTLRFTGSVVLLGQVERGGAASVLADWVAGGGPGTRPLPRTLTSSVVGRTGGTTT